MLINNGSSNQSTVVAHVNFSTDGALTQDIADDNQSKERRKRKPKDENIHGVKYSDFKSGTVINNVSSEFSNGDI